MVRNGQNGVCPAQNGRFWRKTPILGGFWAVGNGFPRVGNDFCRVGNENARVRNDFPRRKNEIPHLRNGFAPVGNEIPRVRNGFCSVGNGIAQRVFDKCAVDLAGAGQQQAFGGVSKPSSVGGREAILVGRFLRGRGKRSARGLANSSCFLPGGNGVPLFAGERKGIKNGVACSQIRRQKPPNSN